MQFSNPNVLFNLNLVIAEQHLPQELGLYGTMDLFSFTVRKQSEQYG